MRPRPAASLIVVDRAAPTPRVLMGRRHGGANFMPGRWVFPGGRCDPADGRMRTATAFTPQTLALLRGACAPGSPRSLPHALGVAAVRETFEETGLRLGQASGRLQGGRPGGTLSSGDLRPDLAALRFVGRAITPTAWPRRFDARFFEADADALDHRVPTPSTELEEVAWLDFDVALGLDLVGVTRRLLVEARHRLTDARRPPLFLPARRGAAIEAALADPKPIPLSPAD